MTSKSITPHELKARILWFQQGPFPTGLDDEIDLVEIISVDSYAAGCLLRYVEGNFIPDCIHILQNCRDELRRITSKIPAETRPYFVELQWLIERVLDRCQ